MRHGVTEVNLKDVLPEPRSVAIGMGAPDAERVGIAPSIPKGLTDR